MECQLKTLALIFCLFALAGVGTLGAPSSSKDSRFAFKCLNDSVIVAFRQPFYNIRMYAVGADPDGLDSYCSRTFTPNEPAIKEFSFKKCSYGSRTMKVYVDEIYLGTVFNTPSLKIDCQVTSVGDALGSVIGAYIDIFGR